MRIFVSYRRADSADAAGRLYDRLAEQFGQHNVFMDVDDIRPGEDYVEAIERRIGNCDTMIVLIGPNWASATNEAGGRRLDDPGDLARLELEAGLRRNVRVIPILVSNAELPDAADLPDSLKPMLRRQAATLGHAGFHKDVDLLFERLGRKVKRHLPRRRVWLAVGGVGVLVVVALWIASYPPWRQGNGDYVRDPATTKSTAPFDGAALKALPESEPPASSPARLPSASTVYVAYAGDPYGCVLNLQLAIGGQTFLLSSNPYAVRGLAEGVSNYQLTGRIQCTAIGACNAAGGGQVEVRDGVTFNLLWQNVGYAQCTASLIEAF
jgi:hypothetical protein